ncbi:MAG: prepilin peptidase [Agathobacter sp.]|nr:prepilin peptidase [Agathobacter sp.]
MKEIILGIWLGVQGGIDLKYKEIPLWFVIVGGIGGIVFCILEGRVPMEVVLACLPGALALVFSKLTKEVMGYGDGIVFLVMGIYLSLERLLAIGMLAFLIAGVVALVLLVVFRKKGNYRIPFLPFLFLAYELDFFIGKGGF